ncbi:MAG: rRNA maturation RNase YbeY [Bacteroidota bacterium]|nr:rRNA maturation RNase YbeY [Bacteroidota bacterium]
MNDFEINFFIEDLDFRLEDEALIREWIVKVITVNNYIPGVINYIFCSDEYLLKMNKKHLNHNYYTDIITFDYVQANQISSDMFISVDRVKDNSSKNGKVFSKELHRVIIHGILHLIGQDDKTDKEKQRMRSLEDKFLSLLV